MTIPEILTTLDRYTGEFPRAALEAAIAQRAAIIPELLRVLEEAVRDPRAVAEAPDRMLHVFAAYLLAQFREPQAYPLLVQLCSAPGEMSYNVFGDTITQGMSQILASVYNGDPEPLKRLVEDPQANEYSRSTAVDTFLVLEASGQMPRAEVVAYFRELFQGRLEREHSFVWDGLVNATADLPAPELLDDVRRTFEDGLANPGVAGLQELERDLRRPPESIDYTGSGSKHLVTDVIAETEWWAAFDKNEREVCAPRPEAPFQSTATDRVQPASIEAPGSTPQTPWRAEPKIGRNDPCPCGSGKKYKKCCLGKP